MIHFAVLVLFSLLVGIVFGVTGREGSSAQIKHGVLTALKFIGFAFLLSWVLYFLPF